MELHPSVNDPVVLRDRAGREYRSRVEELGEGLLVVVRPDDLPADEEFAAGTALDVAWTGSGGGITVLPTRILAMHAEGRLRLWSLVVTGPVSTEQRRRYVRTPADGPVELRSATGSQADPVTGTLLEVSEGSVRCTVASGAADGFLAGSNEVVVWFRLGSIEFTVPGRVEFVRATKHPVELEALVVVFEEPVAEADALRKQIFALERRALRVRGEGGT